MKIFKNHLPKIPLIILLYLIFFSPVLFAQVKVTRVENADQLAGKNGVVYVLPHTVVIAELCISKSQQFAGPLAAFAGELMGIDELITKDAVSYSIEKAVIRAVTEPDPDQVYLVEKEDKSQGEIWLSFEKHPPVMTMESFDKGMGPDGFSNWNKDLYVTSDAGRLFRKYTDSPTREVTDTIVRKVSIDTLVFEETIFRHSRQEYSDLEKAQEAADRIREIEHDQYNLLIGYPETAYSKDALEFMIGRLEEQRLEYLKLFTGVTIKENLVFTFPVIPEKGKENQDYRISGFSKIAGITDAEGQDEILLSLSSVGESSEADDPGEGLTGAGLVYQVPESFQALLSCKGVELDSRRIEVLQLGTKLTLPPAFKRIEFDLETGAVKSVILE